MKLPATRSNPPSYVLAILSSIRTNSPKETNTTTWYVTMVAAKLPREHRTVILISFGFLWSSLCTELFDSYFDFTFPGPDDILQRPKSPILSLNIRKRSSSPSSATGAYHYNKTYFEHYVILVTVEIGPPVFGLCWITWDDSHLSHLGCGSIQQIIWYPTITSAAMRLGCPTVYQT